MPACSIRSHEGQAAAVQDGHFEVVDLHVDVVDAHGVEDAQQVLGGGDQDALAHQAGGVADARHVPPTGGNREGVQAIEIGPQEDDAGGNRRGKNANVHGDAGVKADSGGFDRALHRGFKSQNVSPASELYYTKPSNVTTSI